MPELYDVDAEVGDLKFKSEFSNPDVNVSHDRDQVGHSIVSGSADIGSGEEFVVQAKGRRPAEIEIVGWVTQDQLDVVDDMIGEIFVGIKTDRWVGTAVPKNVRTGYNRTLHDKHGLIFEVTIKMISISNGVLPE